MPKPRNRTKRTIHLEVTGLAPPPPAMEAWERALIEPVLTHLFDVPKPSSTDPREVRDGEDVR